MLEWKSMYISLAPPIFSGIINMIFIKSNILKSWQKPIDGGRCLTDGRRIFGDNKTWRGMAGYVLINMLVSLAWGALAGRINELEAENYLYVFRENTAGYNLLVGILFGLAYALFELPNSFLKRRLEIEPGKPGEGWKKPFFVFLDQADSVIGCALVVWLFYPLGWERFITIILLGAGTHILINMALYEMKLRKNRW